MNFFDRRSPSNPLPQNSVSSHDVVFDPLNNLYFRLFIPHTDIAVNSSLPIIVFFHDGGFAFLSAASNTYDAVCRRFARQLNAVAPEYKFPCQYEDGYVVLKFLDNPNNHRKIPENADVSSVFLAGDSAGGNIANHLALEFGSTSSTFSLLNVIGLINIQPFFGGKERVRSEVHLEGAPIVSMARTQWLWKAFLPNGEDYDHWAVNVSGPNAVDLSGAEKFPATMLVVGGYDPLKDWQMRYHKWLTRGKKDVRKM